MKKTLLFMAMILGMASVVLCGQQVKIATKIIPDNCSIGDPVRYSLEVSVPSGFQVEMPDMAGSFANFTVKDHRVSRRDFFGTLTIRDEYIVVSYFPGNYTIAGLPVKYSEKEGGQWREVRNEAKTLVVKSALQGNTDVTLRDIKSAVWFIPWYWFLILACIIAVCAVVLFIRFKKTAGNALPQVPPRPAHEIALEELDTLKRKDLVSRGDWKTYYSELSDIVRRYLENRFGLAAPDMTTEEFLVYVRDRSILEASYKSLLREFLTASDLVKFAKYIPDAREGDQAMVTARQFVEQTGLGKTESP